MKSSEGVLKYIIINPRQKINLNLFESEKYEPAILIQQLVGNLVYYSNFGRYEPRIAESWKRESDDQWTFKLKKNIKCENGEVINSESFKKSLERSLIIFDKKGGVPVLSSLVGYKEFINKNLHSDNIQGIEGIIANGDALTFKFDKKIKSGLLQILSFSPFGYICEGNFNKNGEWTDNEKFISSGPYKVDKIVIGQEYHLSKNIFWNDFADRSPDRIIISHEVKDSDYNLPLIVDAFTNEYQNSNLRSFRLVPEYLNSVILGNLESGFFKKQKNRTDFKKIFHQESRKALPQQFGVNTRSEYFYPNQVYSAVADDAIKTVLLEKPSIPLVIEGDIPLKGTARWYAWHVLKNVLENNKIEYRFAKNESSFEEITSRKYDIRIRGSSIGGGVEPWGLNVIFCSSVGINFPDPQNEICNMLENYESDRLNDAQLTKMFLETVDRQAAVLPVSHYGVQMYMSSKIDDSTFSPLLAIMKFDQIGLKDGE